MFNFAPQIQVFDDVLDPFLVEYFHGAVFGKTETTNVYPVVEFTAKYEVTAKEGNYTPLSFVHVLKSSAKMSQHLENFSLIPIKLCEHLKVKMKDIYFARLFLTMPGNSSLDHAAPHTDMPIPHWVVLYYVNDADGDTVFFDNNNNIIERVTPKKGRVVLFNGNILHGGGIPKKSPRCVVNFDITI